MTRFHILLLAYLALSFSLWFLPSNAIAEALEQKLASLQPKELYIDFYLTSLICVLDLIAVIGMSFYKDWARTLFVISTLLWIPVYAFQGVTINTGLMSFLYDSAVFMNAVIIMLIYYSPLQVRFLKAKDMEHGK